MTFFGAFLLLPEQETFIHAQSHITSCYCQITVHKIVLYTDWMETTLLKKCDLGSTTNSGQEVHTWHDAAWQRHQRSGSAADRLKVPAAAHSLTQTRSPEVLTHSLHCKKTLCVCHLPVLSNTFITSAVTEETDAGHLAEDQYGWMYLALCLLACC